MCYNHTVTQEQLTGLEVLGPVLAQGQVSRLTVNNPIKYWHAILSSQSTINLVLSVINNQTTVYQQKVKNVYKKLYDEVFTSH